MNNSRKKPLASACLLCPLIQRDEPCAGTTPQAVFGIWGSSQGSNSKRWNHGAFEFWGNGIPRDNE